MPYGKTFLLSSSNANLYSDHEIQTETIHFTVLCKPPTSKASKTLKMSTTQLKPKRPTCLACSKPARTCLCNRIRTRDLDNAVSVTILQHSLERNHPLNSTRIAKLGLKNLNVVTVFEVDFEARFEIRLSEPGQESGLDRAGSESCRFDQLGGKEETPKVGFESSDVAAEGNGRRLDEKSGDLIEKDGGLSLENGVIRSQNAGNSLKGLGFADNLDVSNGEEPLLELTGRKCGGGTGSLAMEDLCETLEKGSNLDATLLSEDERTGFDQNGGPVISATIIKYGNIADLSHIWKLDTQGKKPKFDHILTSPLARDTLAGGFVVKRIERRKLDGKMEVEENEEFEVKIPPGSVLLFPSEIAVGVDDLKSMGFEVKNLIVLDGTWSKAGRVYNENPWLKLLPHLRLDLDKMSLYSEIRHQPKAGCLSTIESIVYTLKALGEDADGLDNLLDVFESMVGNQRRLKGERLSRLQRP